MTVTLNADGAIDLLDDMSIRLQDLSPVFAVIASDLATLIDNSFEKSVSPDGKAWDPLAPATIKRRRGELSTPLVDAGILRRSITTVAGATSVEFGTNIPYAGYHQFGTAVTQYLEEGGTMDMVHVPARPFLPVKYTGELMDEGPAAEEWDKYAELVATFIETGEILEG